jgi:hypothetical protein
MTQSAARPLDGIHSTLADQRMIDTVSHIHNRLLVIRNVVRAKRPHRHRRPAPRLRRLGDGIA